jgi:hypothetical protein
MKGFLGFGDNSSKFEAQVGQTRRVEATGPARINSYSYIVLKCDLASGAMNPRGNFSGGYLSAHVPVNVDPGSEFFDEPRNPLPVPCSSREIARLELSITDENDNPLATDGEVWSARLLLAY